MVLTARAGEEPDRHGAICEKRSRRRHKDGVKIRGAIFTKS
jgi:hypothetical protein